MENAAAAINGGNVVITYKLEYHKSVSVSLLMGALNFIGNFN